MVMVPSSQLPMHILLPILIDFFNLIASKCFFGVLIQGNSLEHLYHLNYLIIAIFLTLAHLTLPHQLISQ